MTENKHQVRDMYGVISYPVSSTLIATLRGGLNRSVMWYERHKFNVRCWMIEYFNNNPVLQTRILNEKNDFVIDSWNDIVALIRCGYYCCQRWWRHILMITIGEVSSNAFTSNTLCSYFSPCFLLLTTFLLLYNKWWRKDRTWKTVIRVMHIIYSYCCSLYMMTCIRVE